MRMPISHQHRRRQRKHHHHVPSNNLLQPNVTNPRRSFQVEDPTMDVTNPAPSNRCDALDGDDEPKKVSLVMGFHQARRGPNLNCEPPHKHQEPRNLQVTSLFPPTPVAENNHTATRQQQPQTTTIMCQQQQKQQENRDVAMDRLSSFFLGEKLKQNSRKIAIGCQDSPSSSRDDQEVPSSLPSKSSLKKLDSPPSSPKPNKSVSFSNVNIREYDLCIGDNPCCRQGVPISLGWAYRECEETKIDDSAREPCPLLSCALRRQMLIQAGFSWTDLRQAVRSAHRTKHERDMTELFLVTAPLEEAVETALSKVRAVLAGSYNNDNKLLTK